MANWVADFLARNPGAQIVKRARHALHVREGERTVAYITGVPCHYEAAPGDWQPLDTEPQWDGTRWTCAGLDVTIDADATVRLGGYSQLTRNVGLFRPSNTSIVGTKAVPLGEKVGDALVADGDWWRVERRITETGYREWLTLKTQPSVPQTKAGDWLVLETIITGVTLPNGWVADKYNISTHWSLAPVAWDASGNPLTCRRYWKDGVLYTGIPVEELAGATYPVVVDPDFAGDTADGYIRGRGRFEAEPYETARSTSQSYYSTLDYWTVGQSWTGSYFYVSRGFLKFDTSSIPDDATITQVNLTLTVYNSAYNLVPFDVEIIKQDWSNQDPLSDENRETAYDNCLAGAADDNIWQNTDGVSTAVSYTSGNLSTLWPSKTGATYYSLRSSRDRDAIEPTGSEYLQLYAQESSWEARRPVLTVAYEAGGTVYEQGVSGTFSAAADLSRLTGKPFTGSFTATGAIARGTGKAASGTLTQSGALSRDTAKSASGTLTQSGALSRLAGKALGGAWTAAGALSHLPNKALSGVFTGLGALSRTTSHNAAGAWTGAGAITKATTRSLAGIWEGSGSLGRGIARTLSGAWSAVGTLGRLTGKATAGAFAPEGTLSRGTAKSSGGTAEFVGSLARTAGKALGGVWTATGVVGTVKAAFRSLAGVWSGTGTLMRGVGKGTAGAFTGSGTLTRLSAKALGGALATAGSLARGVAKLPTGIWSATGTVSRNLGRGLSGVWSGAGALSRRATRYVSGIWSGAGTLARTTGIPLVGEWVATGTLGRGIARTVGGIWSGVGVVSRGVAKSTAGAFSAAGTLSRAVGKALGGDWSGLGELLVIPEALHVFLEGVWSATGSVTRATTKGFAGTLVLSGSVARGIAKFLSGVWSGVGSFVKIRIPRMIAPLYVDSVTGPDTIGTIASPDTLEIDFSNDSVEV